MNAGYTQTFFYEQKPDALLSRLDERDLTSGCWSASRYSVFYIITANGDLKVFDLLGSVQSPARTLNLCNGALRAIAPHGEGKLLAIGGDNGIVYLVESSDALVGNSKHEKAFTTTVNWN